MLLMLIGLFYYERDKETNKLCQNFLINFKLFYQRILVYICSFQLITAVTLVTSLIF